MEDKVYFLEYYHLITDTWTDFHPMLVSIFGRINQAKNTTVLEFSLQRVEPSRVQYRSTQS